MILHACEIPACPWPCLSRVGRFLPLLALLVIFGVVQRCLFFTWRYLALLAFAGVACRSCTLPFANALSVLLLARWSSSNIVFWWYMTSWGRCPPCVFSVFFRQLLASRFSSVAHHHKAVSMRPRRPLGRLGSPFNHFGIDFGAILAATFC